MILIKKLSLILLLFFFIGCASFSKIGFIGDYKKLKSDNINSLNGTYKFHPTKVYEEAYKDMHPDTLKFTNLYKEIVNDFWENNLELDSTKVFNEDEFYVQLNIKNDSILKIKLLENQVAIRDTMFKGKIKNGMFYIDNKNLSFNKIPFLFGGYSSDKRRIGISKANNLITNEAIGNEGALLFIIGSGYSYNISFEFERVK